MARLSGPSTSPDTASVTARFNSSLRPACSFPAVPPVCPEVLGSHLSSDHPQTVPAGAPGKIPPIPVAPTVHGKILGNKQVVACCTQST